MSHDPTMVGPAGFSFRQPQNNLAVALAATAQGPQPVDHVRLKPDQALALLVGLVLEANTTERQRPGDRLETRLG